MSNPEKIQTSIWFEEAEHDNPYATKAAYCAGYNVYEDIVGNCSWSEMLFLLFKGEAATEIQSALLNDLAVAIANPGPRDASIHAAMCGGVGKSVAASSLMAALAVGAGQYSGAREVFLIMQNWQNLGKDLNAWKELLTSAPDNSSINTWPKIDHQPGFDPYGQSTPTSIASLLSILARNQINGHLVWLQDNRKQIESYIHQPITMTMVIAAALLELDFSPEQGEMLTLLLRLPGAAAHTLEQQKNGHKKFPFYPIEYTNKENI